MRFPFETVLGSLPAVASYIFHWVSTYQGSPQASPTFRASCQATAGKRQIRRRRERSKDLRSCLC